MKIVDKGSGPPVVVIPGIQGRWEWMRPGIEALAERCRVVTFSLCDEPSCEHLVAASAADGFDRYVEQVREAMDQAGMTHATICGVSYGGLIAAAFAARYPERTRGLVLLSALPPSWRPDARARFYLRAPRLLTPVFMFASLRILKEICTAHRGLRATVNESVRHGWNVLTHMFSPTRMAGRVRLLDHASLDAIGTIGVPVLIITGESELDRIVPVNATREYLKWLPQARTVTVERTGHIGFITRPDAFADLIAPFAADGTAVESRRRIG